MLFAGGQEQLGATTATERTDERFLVGQQPGLGPGTKEVVHAQTVHRACLRHPRGGVWARRPGQRKWLPVDRPADHRDGQGWAPRWPPSWSRRPRLSPGGRGHRHDGYRRWSSHRGYRHGYHRDNRTALSATAGTTALCGYDADRDHVRRRGYYGDRTATTVYDRYDSCGYRGRRYDSRCDCYHRDTRCDRYDYRGGATTGRTR